jgi:hypothetical protein
VPTTSPSPDFAIIVCNDEIITTTLSAFLADNETLDAETVAALRALPEGQTYRDGGAGGEWSVTRKLDEPADPTLHEALALRGYSSVECGAYGKRRIYDVASGRIVGDMTAHEAWSALRDGSMAVSS